MLLPSAKLVKKVRSFAEELEPLAPHIDLKDLFRIFVNLGSARIASPLRDCLARLICGYRSLRPPVPCLCAVLA